tara:strand:- start:733 stop:975 length:243 start_codon:yes stop_codon:yes gene_type:complete
MILIEYIILSLNNYSESQLETISSKCASPLITGRINSDGTKRIIKIHPENLPDFCNTLTLYSRSEISEVVKSKEWQLTDV